MESAGCSLLLAADNNSRSLPGMSSISEKAGGKLKESCLMQIRNCNNDMTFFSIITFVKNNQVFLREWFDGTCSIVQK